MKQENFSRPGENVTLVYIPHKNVKDNQTHVTYWINKTSNNYLGFENKLILENVTTVMQRENIYVQCTTGAERNKCTKTVPLQINGKSFNVFVTRHDRFIALQQYVDRNGLICFSFQTIENA